MQTFRLMYPHIGSLIGLFRLCGHCSESLFACLLSLLILSSCFTCRTLDIAEKLARQSPSRSEIFCRPRPAY